MLNWIYFVVILTILLLLFGMIMKEYLLIGIMGMFLAYLGAYIALNGIVGVNNDVTKFFGVVFGICGAILFLKEAMYQLESLGI